jgi:hypothetical protein
MTFISGWWVSGYPEATCSEKSNKFTTCKQVGVNYGDNATNHVDNNGEVIEVCRIHEERIDISKSYMEFYDVCNEKQVLAKCLRPAFCTSGGCIPTRSGVLCESCEEGYGEQVGRICVPCKDSSMAVFSGIFCAIFILFIIFLMCLRRWIRRHRRFLTVWKEVIEVMKINIDFMQINSSLPNVLSTIVWPEMYIEFLASLNFVDMDLLTATGATCLKGVNFITKFFGMSTIPIVSCLIGLAVFVYGKKSNRTHLNNLSDDEMVKEVTNSANEIFIMIDADHNGILEPDEVNDFLISIGEKKKNHTHDMNQSQFIQMMLKMNNGKKMLNWWWDQRLVSHSLNTSVQLLLIIYTPVTKKIFQFFNCHKITDEMIYLREDFSVECYETEWNIALLYVTLVALVFAAGFPATISLYLYRHWKELNDPRVKSRIGFLYSSYRRGSEFWEVHELARKTFLTGVIIFIDTPMLKIIFALFVNIIAVVTLNYFQPYKNRSVFWIAQLSFFVTNFKYVVASIFLKHGSATNADYAVMLIVFDTMFFVGSIIAGTYTVYSLLEKIKQIEESHKIKLTAIVPVKSVPIENEKALEKLQKLRLEYGAGSTEYKSALEEIRATKKS